MNWAEYAKLAPIVAYPGWESAVKENRFLLEKLTELRLKGAKVCFERKKRALEFEALLYLYTASLAIPFSEEWFRIYMFLFKKYFPEAGAIVHSERIVLTERENSLLRGLRKWIFKQQLKRIAEKRKRGGVKQEKRSRSRKKRSDSDAQSTSSAEVLAFLN